MALIVEDGTGLANAESYVSVADFKAFCDGMGYSYAFIESDTDLEIALRKATAYVDGKFRYKGTRLLASQMLEFPRSGCVDWSGFEATGVPARVKRATSELAFKSFKVTLNDDLDRGGMVKSESVGPISVTYVDGAPAGKVFMQAKNYLDPYIRDPGGFDMHTGPRVTLADPYFQLTTDDDPGLSSIEVT
jgi:hypothetical protein